MKEWLKERGVLSGSYTGKQVRFVTHYGIGTSEIDRLIDLLTELHAN